MKKIIEKIRWSDLLLYLFERYDSRDGFSQNISLAHIEHFGILKAVFWVISGIVLTSAMGWLG